ncbi:MAG: hypothetical protein ACRCXL_10090 [Dermatophilaceae bacterium]
MSGRVDLDRVAQALGVSSDDEIVDEVTALRSRLGVLADDVADQRERLDGSVPGADFELAVARAGLADATIILGQVITAAEAHERGVR